MADWKTIYQERNVTAEEAISYIKSGDSISVAHVGSEPFVLLEEMVRQAERLRDVHLYFLLSLGDAGYMQPGLEKHIRFHGIFLGNSTRKGVAEGRGEYLPCYFHQYPAMLRARGGIDVLLISVTPPDKHGYCSMGMGIDHIPDIKDETKLIIAQVNPALPRVMGNSFIHVSEIDYLVEAERQIPELAPVEITEVEKQIGAYCASLIQDGDTLQLGIGGIPDAVVTFLKEKNDLGLHTEMAADGVVDLIRAGNINNRRKNINRGKSVSTFAAGTKKLYDFLDDNPAFELHPVSYVNHPNVISQNDNVVSINSCIQVDLMGQANAEVVKGMQFSGVGGQIDFIRGANMSRGGRAIMALPSTAANGTISKIVPFLDHGAPVTTGRAEINYVVTEYGIAQLWGKTLRERAREMIAIAHPDYREELKAEFERKYFEKL